MASSISAGTTSATALVHTADTTGALELKTNNGTVAVTIDTSQNVGIGTSSPTNKLHVASSSFETIKLQGTSTVSGINFVNSASSNGYIYYDNGPNMLFYTNGTEQARIDSSGNFKFNSGYGSVATAYGCRAWVNFNGTGTPAIRGSGNVSSLTDNGTGNYSVNFTTAMPDENYAAVVTTEESGVIATSSGNNGFQQTAAIGRIGIYVGTSSSFIDIQQINYVVLR